ncbi:hypothetical protein [Thermodesulfovibrio sp. TK110]
MYTSCQVSGYSSAGIYGCPVAVASGNIVYPPSCANPRSGTLYFIGNYICPLSGGSACSGNPPTCTKGQACVTNSTTVTKWQCSLNGVQYDTQDQCTTSCYRTATCNTNYKCTYESSVYSDFNTCLQNCSYYQCPVTGDVFFSQSSCQNACPSFVCSHNNATYSTMYDCVNACKEASSCVKQ